MAKISMCPDVGKLSKLATGRLRPTEMESLVQHLEECKVCLAKVPTLGGNDTLVETLTKAATRTGEQIDPVLSRVIERLVKVEQAVAPETAAKPKTFACTNCGKNLKVKAELAGKKVKCPAAAWSSPCLPSLPWLSQPALASLLRNRATIRRYCRARRLRAKLSDEGTMLPTRDTKSGLVGTQQAKGMATWMPCQERRRTNQNRSISCRRRSKRTSWADWAIIASSKSSAPAAWAWSS